ncbi:MAG TPA: cysteine dioxygenase family protein [Pyrinomonadaceae bacterium]|nr:cysteine dioxygenase family protein [Pyrinomonadaceae bacterium]
MNRVSIDNLLSGLRLISDEEFTCNNVYEFLSDNPVDVDSIAKYFFWRPDFYTRNLIYKDNRFELMAVCWESGQASVVHNHADQKCWMTVPVGRLRGQNFAVTDIDESRKYCKLAETDTFDLSNCLAAKVELEEPIHQILNLAEFGERAVSIHIYSKPFNRCLAYCRETDTFKEVELCYYSIDGRPVNTPH